MSSESKAGTPAEPPSDPGAAKPSGLQSPARPKIRVLIVEDSPADADAVIIALERAGFDPQWERVADPQALAATLHDRWDIIIAAYTLAAFEQLSPLEMLSERGLELPLIVTSRTIGDDLALSALRSGAQDFVAKGHLERLGPAVERALRTAAQRQRLEAELRQAQKMEAVGRLAGGIAHDLNNVLTVIQSFGEMIEEELEDGASARDYVSQVLEAAERAGNLTRQLLAFSRRQTVDPKIVTFNEIATDTDRMLRRVIGEDIEVHMELTENPWRIKIDPGHFEQVLLNLVVNARDAMPTGGHLSLETANVILDQHYAASHGVKLESGDYAMLAVSDTGTGIPEDVKTRIFEPFFTTKEKGKGTGLGLSTCYGIVKQAGGFIWVYSEPGLGTTFKVYVPRSREARRRPTTNVPIVADATGTERLLVVEDDSQVRALLIEALTHGGYEVHAARNGIDALELVERSGLEFDLLITDVVMPKMGGKSLAERLRALQPGLEVLFMSGYTDDAIAPHGLLDERVELLEKPFTPAQLAVRIRGLLDEPRDLPASEE